MGPTLLLHNLWPCWKFGWCTDYDCILARKSSVTNGSLEVERVSSFFLSHYGHFNPISTAIFLTLMYRGRFWRPPLEMAFLQQKCANFGPEVKFDKILAIFWSLLQIFSLILTILAFLTLNRPKIATSLKIGLQICYIPQKKAKIM